MDANNVTNLTLGDAAVTHAGRLKQKLIDALRKTGHVSENALEAVAEVAVKVTFGFAGED